MTPEEVNSQMQQLQETLGQIGVPLSSKIYPEVKINTRAKRRLGCCYYKGESCVIEVSAYILDKRELVRTTLIHELIHTCPGCRNHGAKWKAYAQLAGEKLGCEISRTVQQEGSGEPLRRDEVRYVVQCQSCGKEFLRCRMSKVVKYPWRYRCSCGGKLKRIK